MTIEPLRINLRAPVVSPYRVRSPYILAGALLITAVAAALILDALMAAGEVRVREAALARARDERTKLERALSEVTAAVTVPRHQAVVTDVQARRAFSWVRFLDQLETTIPAGVTLLSITPALEENGVSLSGWARDIAPVTELIQNLSGPFADVFLLSQRRATEEERRQLGGLGIRFDLAAKFPQPVRVTRATTAPATAAVAPEGGGAR